MEKQAEVRAAWLVIDARSVESRPRMRRVATNLFICVLLFLMVADAMPSFGSFHQRIKEWIDPVLDITGLWQGDWTLFAPEVVKRNARMSAEILCTNGVTLLWNSPMLHELSIPERFLAFRDGEFFDTIRNDSESGAWESMADYLARTEVALALPDESPVSIRLYRHWWDVPPAGSNRPRPPEMRFQIYQKSYTP